MFFFVGVFGVGTVVFGVSTTVWLSVLALIVMGGADMVSVYVRETLIQLWTPDHVRGRVNAVNGVFVGASNELGEFRAGVSAWLFGAVPAVVIGGIGTIGDGAGRCSGARGAASVGGCDPPSSPRRGRQARVRAASGAAASLMAPQVAQGEGLPRSSAQSGRRRTARGR